jgi:hypothetical protein
MLPYLPSLATVALALLQLAKDWGAHQAHWRRALVLLAIMLLGVGGTVNTYYASKKSEAQRIGDQRRIAGLEEAVKTANTNQEANTKQFVQSFGDLSGKLSDLQTQLKTANLQKEAAQLRAELEATQKAMSPPKAELQASLGELDVNELWVAQSPDGSVEFTVNVINKSKTQAKNGSIFVRLCRLCEFKEEPERFRKPIGASTYDREMPFESINAGTAIAIPLKVRPPTTTRRFEVDIMARCQNCVFREKDSLFIDHYSKVR